MKGWKVVVRNSQGHFYSATTINSSGIILTHRKDCIEYLIHEWVKPNIDCGPLRIFKNRKAARRFAKNQSTSLANPMIVFRCEYRKSNEKSVWYTQRGRKFIWDEDRLPTYTILASTVKLLK